jgi:hypothetical protein
MVTMPQGHGGTEKSTKTFIKPCDYCLSSSAMTQITEETFELTLRSFISSEEINLADVSFIDPYGMLGILEIGELCTLEDVRKTVILPKAMDVLAYLDRIDFFTHARCYFLLQNEALFQQNISAALIPMCFSDNADRNRTISTS